MNYLNDFVITYLNDIMMYNNTKKEYIKHVKKILQRLRKIDIQVDVDKCEFHIIEMKFLERIIRRDDIKINSEKIVIIIK
jgi:esterase/lipase superfamily enzyme